MIAGSRIKRAGWLALLLGAACAAADAQNWPTLAPIDLEGDAARGDTLAFECKGCHGVPGARNMYPSYRVPKLGGQNADYIEIALQGYRRGSRFHQTMHALAAGLSDQDIADLAAYFASDAKAHPAAGRSSASAAAIRAGEQKATSCAPCHGEAGMAQSSQWPNLAGQHASYLEQALKQYRSGMRSSQVMQPLVGSLDDETLADLAAYFAAQHGLSNLADE